MSPLSDITAGRTGICVKKLFFQDHFPNLVRGKGFHIQKFVRIRVLSPFMQSFCYVQMYYLIGKSQV